MNTRNTVVRVRGRSANLPPPGPHIRKALSSSAWLLSERGIALLLNFIVGIVLARYLGPRDLGALSYAIAFIGLLATIPYLGFASVVVQQLVTEEHSHDEVLGTVIWSKVAAALLAFALGNIIAHFIVPGWHERMLILLVSFSMLFDVASALRLHFEARTESRLVALVSSISGVAGAITRVIAIAAVAPLWVFAALVSVQSVVTAIGYVAAYHRSTGACGKLRFDLARARKLFAISWPLIVSSAAATVYLKIDQFMLGQMKDMAAVGTYAVAARLSEIWYLIPTAVAASAFPRLVALKTSDPDRYEWRMTESLRYAFWLSLAIAIPVTFVGPWLITTLYGMDFREAGLILSIHIWACPAVFMGTIVEKWFVTEGLLKYLISRQLMSAFVNVILNLLLIPKFGGAGSAVATVVAYTLAYYVSCYTSRRTFKAGNWMSEAIIWPLLELRRRRAN